jgi:CheY-like chemotaxis protein
VTGKELIAIVGEARRRGRHTSGFRRRIGRILVVDDEPLLSGVIVQFLSRSHEVDVVARGRDALRRILSGSPYDVVLCDVAMPEMNGLDLHAAVVRMLPAQGGAFVFVTDPALDPVLRRRLALLPNATLEKPFDIDQVERIVDDRIQRWASDRGVRQST